MVCERTVPVLKNVSIDLDVVSRLASLGLTSKEIAGYWGMNATQFEELCDDHPEITEAYLAGMSQGMADASLVLREATQLVH